MDQKIVAKTKHGELTLDQLAEVQPGMARLMKEIGERYGILYHSAKGGNWKLAHHELKQITSLMRAGEILRPKYSKDLTDFIESELEKINKAIASKSWKDFDAAFKVGIEKSNSLHEKYGYGFIRYVISGKATEGYDLNCRE